MGLGLAASGFASFAMAEPVTLRMACVQMDVTADKDQNLAKARAHVATAAKNGAKLVVLPEIFNSPYANASFPVYAEEHLSQEECRTKSPSIAMLSDAAKDNGVYLIGGSIPEREGSKVYNTTFVFGPDGGLIAKHRKTHLFDIDIPGKITFRESDTLTPGDAAPTVFDTPFGKVGLAICYDMRFPEMAILAQQAGCRVMVYPAAFNTTTGPVHWELLMRARALDNFLFVATASPARNATGEGYQAWGHSTVVDPWGKVIATTGHTEDIIYADCDFAYQDQVRSNIPILTQKRKDLYTVALVK